MERIVIGIDDSEPARAALAQGLELAWATGAGVTIVHSIEMPDPFGDGFYHELEAGDELRRAHALIAAATAQAERAGVETDHEICHGDAVEDMISVARSRDADMIVVGSRGLGLVREAVLGSVSHALVRRSPVPVLIVRQRLAAAEGDVILANQR